MLKHDFRFNRNTTTIALASLLQSADENRSYSCDPHSILEDKLLEHRSLNSVLTLAFQVGLIAGLWRNIQSPGAR